MQNESFLLWKYKFFYNDKCLLFKLQTIPNMHDFSFLCIIKIPTSLLIKSRSFFRSERKKSFIFASLTCTAVHVVTIWSVVFFVKRWMTNNFSGIIFFFFGSIWFQYTLISLPERIASFKSFMFPDVLLSFWSWLYNNFVWAFNCKVMRSRK